LIECNKHTYRPTRVFREEETEFPKTTGAISAAELNDAVSLRLFESDA